MDELYQFKYIDSIDEAITILKRNLDLSDKAMKDKYFTLRYKDIVSKIKLDVNQNKE